MTKTGKSARLPTISEVARAAGVSKATVSRVLSGNFNYIRIETRQKVQQAIDELDYRPSTIARSLTSRRTHTIGLLVSDVSNPFYPEVIHGVEDVAFQAGYQIFLGNTNYDLGRGLALVQSLVDRRADGLLIMASSMSSEWLEVIQAGRLPLVVVDWDFSENAGQFGQIEIDFEAGVHQMVDYLCEMGHQRFAHISGPLHLPTSRLRRDAFLTALQAKGIPAEQVSIIPGDLRIEGGYKAIYELMNPREAATAVFAANDLTAIGIIRALHEMGLHVPDDLSVVGLDDIWLAGQNEPPITTIALPRYEIGVQAMQMLLQLIGALPSSKKRPLKLKINTHLVIRQTTGPVKRK